MGASLVNSRADLVNRASSLNCIKVRRIAAADNTTSASLPRRHCCNNTQLDSHITCWRRNTRGRSPVCQDLRAFCNEGTQEMRVWDPAGTSRLSVRVQGQTGVVCLSYQGQTAFEWTIKAMTRRSTLVPSVRIKCEGYPALTSSRSENQTKGIIEVGQIID